MKNATQFKQAKQSKIQRALLLFAACATVSTAAFAQNTASDVMNAINTISAAREHNSDARGGGRGEKSCVKDMTTGIANWKMSGTSTNAFVITPYQYWSSMVQTSTHAPLSTTPWLSATGVKWINNNASNVSPAGTYVYDLDFNVPKQCVGKKITLEGYFSGDNDAKVELIDGAAIGLAHTIYAPNYGFMDGHQGAYNVTHVFSSAGVKTLRATVTNVGSYSGFTMRAMAHQ